MLLGDRGNHSMLLCPTDFRHWRSQQGDSRKHKDLAAVTHIA
jgi:hypothetical protein